MKAAEYNGLCEALHIGHEISFMYKNKTYFLERTPTGYALYDISDTTSGDTGRIVCKFGNSNLHLSVNDFLQKKIFDGLSFSEIYDKVVIDYIE
ncbi:MAG: hypothetical protein PUH99_06010 [Firmicutes bacterium]|nr:hypothetical protein [Bacillota bacterium]MDY5531393.1 hypothetical protein [Pumilibacteraceae bacterium]